MTQYASYQTSTQNYGTSYSTQSSSYGADITIQRKGRCPTNGRCQVCTRLCMMD